MGKAMLIVVLGITFVMGKTLTGLNKRSLPLDENTAAYYKGLIARNIANSGANMALSKLSADPEWRDGLSSIQFDGGNFTVTVTDRDSVIELTSTGSYGGIEKSIKVPLTFTGYWPYVLFTDAKKLKLKAGTGTVTGDIHSNDKVEINYKKYNVAGTVTETLPEVYPPTVDWTFFKNKAIAAGQYVNGDKTFDSAGSPYTGVWYTRKNAKIEANAVINGTIVAEKYVKLEGDNISLTATPSSHPAIISGKKVLAKKKNIRITGFVFCDHFHAEGDGLTVKGAIVARETFHKEKGKNKQITYDETYVANTMAGITFNELNGFRLRILSWQEF
jgi:cytoskeletal protein CcmA (bactofilin family)